MNDLLEFAMTQEATFGGGKGFGPTHGNPSDDGDTIAGYPSGHIPFIPKGAIALPTVGGEATIVEFTVPVGYNGVITELTNVYLGGGFDPTAASIVWRVLANNRAIRNFENIVTQTGSLETPAPIPNLRVYAGQVIKMIVYHANNALLNGAVAGGFTGYFYPAKR
jgi:hypothetical protein